MTQRISGPGGADIAFDIPAADRMRLLEGLDDIGLTLKHMDEIVQWEATRRHGAALAANGAGQPLKRETRDERTQETSGDHGGQAPCPDARRL